MKQRFGIGFFMALAVIAVTVTVAGQLGYQHARKKAMIEIAAKEREEAAQLKAEIEAEEKEEALAADGQALKEDCFYLMESNGYVVVYLSDRETVYEYTDIVFDGLPEKVQAEIRNGKYMESPEELYGFLESYSS